MLSQVNELLAKVPRDSGALVITGREGLFSGGFDLKTLATGDMEKITKMVQFGYRLLLELYSFDRPIIAAVSGHSIALGLFVTCSADYRIAVDGQYVCQANEVRNNMDIPTQIMEILKARVNKNYFYPAVLHADAYSVQDSIAVGYIDGQNLLCIPCHPKSNIITSTLTVVTVGQTEFTQTTQAPTRTSYSVVIALWIP